MAVRVVLAIVLSLLALWTRGRWAAYCVARTAVGDIDAAGHARPDGDKIAGVVYIAGASVSGLLAARVCSNRASTAAFQC